jgi:hypothetical protein
MKSGNRVEEARTPVTEREQDFVPNPILPAPAGQAELLPPAELPFA